MEGREGGHEPPLSVWDRISEKISCKESAIFFANLAMLYKNQSYIHIPEYYSLDKVISTEVTVFYQICKLKLNN